MYKTEETTLDKVYNEFSFTDALNIMVTLMEK